ncbi:MAG TPA: hypothetical protein VK919_09930 [Solirubrobacterales bacterium]|nr:hypothetical protein [Solirubrobacterales bacterium]
MLADEFLPAYDIADAVAAVVDADRGTTWEALLDVDLVEVARSKPLIGALGAVRMLPETVSHLLHGERPPAAPEHLRLRDTAEVPWQNGGWTLLAERPADEIALGLVGKFWRPVISFAEVSADEFKEFSEPGYAKHVYSLGVRDLDHGTLLRGEMRVATTDERARRWFRRYWAFGVGSGAHVLVQGVLESARDRAEEAVSQMRDGGRDDRDDTGG